MNMNCKEAKNLISPYMDGELSKSIAEELLNHLGECQGCQQTYQEMAQISELFRSAGKIITPAPEGFKDSVMQRIAEKQGAGQSVVLTRLKRSWKQMAASAAAVVLLVFASYTYALPPLIQLADNNQTPLVSSDTPDNVEATNNDSTDLQQPNEDSDPTVIGQDTPDSAQPDSQETDNSQVIDTTEPQQTEKAPVLLSEDQQNIKTILLKISASAESSYDKAISAAQNSGAQTESLGQQVKDDISYHQIKIVVSRNNEAVLLDKLRSLGDMISEQEDYKDISTAYKNTLDQYNSLNHQKSSVDDPDEVQQLSSEIKSLADKLGAFKQQSDQVTIVLWLQE